MFNAGLIFLSTIPPVMATPTLIVIIFDEIASQTAPLRLLVDFLLKKVVSNRVGVGVYVLAVAKLMSSHAPPLTLFCH